METVKTKILRIDYQAEETLGNLLIYDSHLRILDVKCLELPWKNNQVGVSCILPGFYELHKHVSPNHGPCLWIKAVGGGEILPGGRSEVLIHKANWAAGEKRQLKGCVAPGESFSDIDQDGWLDVTYSKKTLDRIH